uniref:Uncharacterized protein n=1 Tax=Vespula pensylvanica TaxID=30213 RepID=A0A834N8H5_VESPE|nr:hypothetical protein H0235_016261 [Vespula pensylvanica]
MPEGVKRISWGASTPFVREDRREGSIATTNNAVPDLHDWIGVSKLKLPPGSAYNVQVSTTCVLYRDANARN